MVATLQERAKTLVELIDLAQFYLTPTVSIDATAARKFLKPEILEPLQALRAQLATVSQWNVEMIHGCFTTVDHAVSGCPSGRSPNRSASR